MKFCISLVFFTAAFLIEDVTAQVTCPDCEPLTCPPYECPTQRVCPTTWYPMTCPDCEYLTCPPCPTQPSCPTTTWRPITDCPVCVPTYRPTTNTYSTFPPTAPTTTACPPTNNISTPTFSKTFYTTSVPSWPTSGTRVHPGIAASTNNGDLILFSLIDPPSFIQLVNEDILFTNDVTEGAYVGPNNVLTLEVEATVYTDNSRSSRSVILVIFPRPTRSDDEFLEPAEIKY